MIINENGISEILSFKEIQEQYQQLFLSVFGEDLDLSSYTPQAQLIDLLSNHYQDLQLAFMSGLNQLSPNTATGPSLDNWLKVFNIERLQATKSSVDLELKGIPNTVIPLGSRVQNSNGDIFVSNETLTIDASGVIDSTFIAEKEGMIKVEANSVNVILDNTLGWNSVNNPNVGNQGREIETDREVRDRKDEILDSLGVDNLSAIVGSLSNLDGVTNVKGKENPSGGQLYIQKDGTLSSVSNSLPIKAHSSYIFVEGGEISEIGDIYSKKKGAEATNGDISTNAIYSSVPINFQRFKNVEVNIKLSLKKLSNFPTDGLDQIDDNITNYMNDTINDLENCIEYEKVENNLYTDDLYQVVKMTQGVRIISLSFELDTNQGNNLQSYEGEYNELVKLKNIEKVIS